MKMSSRQTLVRYSSAFALLSLTACGSVGLSQRSSSDPGEIESLRRQIVELRQRATVCEVDSSRAKQQISELRSELAAARLEIDHLTSDAARLETLASESAQQPFQGNTERVEVVELEDSTSEPDLRRPSTEPSPPDPDHSEPLSRSAGAAAPSAVTSPPTAEALALYDEGYTLFHQQDYAAAAARFEEFVRRYPATDFTDNAQFWIGESLYAQGDFSAALSAFIRTVDDYPNGNKVSDALFKAGKCLEALGQADQARQTYLEVQEKFPQSTAAAGARERLAAGQ